MPEYRISLAPDGQLSGVEVTESIPDSKFDHPVDLHDLIGGRTGRIESFDASGNLVDIDVNTFDQRGRLEKTRREIRLTNGRKRIDIHELHYDGKETPIAHMDPAKERKVEMIMGPDGRMIRSSIQEHDREGLVSSEIEDREQGTRHLYHRGPPGIGFDRTENLTA